MRCTYLCCTLHTVGVTVTNYRDKCLFSGYVCFTFESDRMNISKASQKDQLTSKFNNKYTTFSAPILHFFHSISLTPEKFLLLDYWMAFKLLYPIMCKLLSLPFINSIVVDQTVGKTNFSTINNAS